MKKLYLLLLILFLNSINSIAQEISSGLDGKEFKNSKEKERNYKFNKIKRDLEKFIITQIDSSSLKYGKSSIDETLVLDFEKTKKYRELYFIKNPEAKDFINSLYLYYSPPPILFESQIIQPTESWNKTIVTACSNSVVPPTTLNGINITESYTGSVGTYPNAYSSCGGTVTTPANSKWLGQNGSFAYTMNFSQPINNLVIAITATGGLENENFIFTTNGGLPTITTTNSCFSTISGNVILSGAGAPSSSTGGGGVFTITAPNYFTSITISGNGLKAGSLLSVCSNSIVTCTPTFTQVAPICSGATLNPLPTTSNNGIVGTWSPAINNLATTTYTFTPSEGICNTTATMTITILPETDPNCSSNCPPNLVFSTVQTVVNAIYKASNTIVTNSNYLVNPGSTITLVAGNSITFSPNSEVKSSSTSNFTARLAPCTQTSAKMTPPETEITVNNELLLFPNPTNDFTIIHLNNGEFKKVIITTIEGRVVLNEVVKETSDYQCNTNPLISGIYIVSIETNNGEIISRKLIKR